MIIISKCVFAQSRARQLRYSPMHILDKFCDFFLKIWHHYLSRKKHFPLSHRRRANFPPLFQLEMLLKVRPLKSFGKVFERVMVELRELQVANPRNFLGGLTVALSWTMLGSTQRQSRSLAAKPWRFLYYLLSLISQWSTCLTPSKPNSGDVMLI